MHCTAEQQNLDSSSGESALVGGGEREEGWCESPERGGIKPGEVWCERRGRVGMKAERGSV
jgi:hypothetical protein